jgi:hypothetical protein
MKMAVTKAKPKNKRGSFQLTPEGGDYTPLLANDPRERSCAVLTLKGADQWSKDGRAVIAEWLRHQAKALETQGHKYAGRFRARYVAVSP